MSVVNTVEKKSDKNEKILKILDYLPSKLMREIMRIGSARRDYPYGLSEIRIRANMRSSVVLSGVNIPLFTRISKEELYELYDKIIGGSVYAHVGEIKNGFVSIFSGIRVGVIASLSEREGLPNSISGLVFRLPISPSESADKLFFAWLESNSGMLIYSLPAGGKTSALRALAGKISRELMIKVAVIDERREFNPDDYSDTAVDIMQGYSKHEGLEIALRTLSPDVILVDEIGNDEESLALLRVGRGGVPIIATAHAASFDEVIRKSSVKKLVDEGYFKIFARLYREGGAFLCDISNMG